MNKWTRLFFNPINKSILVNNYRFYSYRIDEGLISRTDYMLECLERDRICADFYCLARAPLLCAKLNLNHRFINILDRWWNRVYSLHRNGEKILTKPTSTIHNLSKLNQDGVIMKKLNQESLTILFNLASKIDFRTLRDRHDVTSYLSGIRDLICEPRSMRIVYPNLKPNSNDLILNLEKYLKEQSIYRKEKYDQNPNDKEGDWIFMIKDESMSILLLLRQLEIDLHLHHQSSDGNQLLILLCQLIKEGFDYLLTHRHDHDQNQEKEIPQMKSDLSIYADIWINWRLDPDRFASESWKMWFKIYDGIFSTKTIDTNFLLDHLLYLKYFPQIVQQFDKIDFFQSIMENWLCDLESNFRRLCQEEEDGNNIGAIERMKCLTDTIYSLGRFIKFLSSISNNRLINRLEKTFLILVSDFLAITDNFKAMDNLALSRFLTGLRQFQLSKPSNINKYPSSNLNSKNKLSIMLNKYLDNITDDSSCNLFQIIPSLMLQLRRLEINLDYEISMKLIRLFERGFVGRSDRLLKNDPKQFLLSLTYFGESCLYFMSINNRFIVSDQIWREFYSSAKIFLESNSINRSAIDDESTTTTSTNNEDWPLDDLSKPYPISAKEYAYFLGVILNVTRRLNFIQEFKPLKTIWENRLRQLTGIYNSKGSYLLARQMKSLMNNYHIRFDQEILQQLRSKGTRWAEILNKRKGTG